MKNPIKLLEGMINDLLDTTKTQKVENGIDHAFITNLEKIYASLINTLGVTGTTDKAVKTENSEIKQLLFADLKHINNELKSKSSSKSLFAMAYFYDALLNNQLAKAEQADAWSAQIEKPDFQKRLAGLLQVDANTSTTSPFLILASTQESKEKKEHIQAFYSAFIRLAFGLNFKSPEEEGDFFRINTTKNMATVIENDSLEKVLAELNELIGLDNVKKDITDLINVLTIQGKRSEKGLKKVEMSLHTVFLGPPGTGKTTVARLLSRIYKHLGYLSQGQCVETDREGLVAGYVGQTAIKVNEVVNKSIGGVLFIDEAYALTQNLLGNDYGSEAVNTLLKRMEDARDNFAVVVAGYTEPMKLFVESNPGLRSRFNRYFYFDHFSPTQLMQIFKLFLQKADFELTVEAEEKLNDVFALLHEKRDEGFGNARVVRNIFEQCIENQATRLVKRKRHSKKALMTFEEADIPEPKQAVDEAFMTTIGEDN